MLPPTGAIINMGALRYSPKRLAAALKSVKAMELRLAGATYDQIAQQLEYKDKGHAYHAIQSAINRIEEAGVEEYRKVNLERLNRARLANWPQVRQGDPRAIATEIAIQEREARYLGLDRQPTDAAAQALALAATQVTQVFIQVGAEKVALGEWRRLQLQGPVQNGAHDDNGNSD